MTMAMANGEKASVEAGMQGSSDGPIRSKTESGTTDAELQASPEAAWNEASYVAFLFLSFFSFLSFSLQSAYSLQALKHRKVQK